MYEPLDICRLFKLEAKYVSANKGQEKRWRVSIPTETDTFIVSVDDQDYKNLCNYNIEEPLPNVSCKRFYDSIYEYVAKTKDGRNYAYGVPLHNLVRAINESDIIVTDALICVPSDLVDLPVTDIIGSVQDVTAQNALQTIYKQLGRITVRTSVHLSTFVADRVFFLAKDGKLSNLQWYGLGSLLCTLPRESIKLLGVQDTHNPYAYMCEPFASCLSDESKSSILARCLHKCSQEDQSGVYVAAPYTKEFFEEADKLSKFISKETPVVSTWTHAELNQAPTPKSLYEAAATGMLEISKSIGIACLSPEQTTSGALFVEAGLARSFGASVFLAVPVGGNDEYIFTPFFVDAI